jgi:hypothetical protein
MSFKYLMDQSKVFDGVVIRYVDIGAYVTPEANWNLLTM